LIRKRLAEMIKDISESIVYCLKAQSPRANCRHRPDVREVASFPLFFVAGSEICNQKWNRAGKPWSGLKRVFVQPDIALIL